MVWLSNNCEVVLVSNDEICAAIKDIYEDVRSIAEPAGALATAGLNPVHLWILF
jgi:threonine dehydratase